MVNSAQQNVYLILQEEKDQMTNFNFKTVYDTGFDFDFNKIVKDVLQDLYRSVDKIVVDSLGIKTEDDILDAVSGGVWLEVYAPETIQPSNEMHTVTITKTFSVKEDWGPNSVEEEIPT